MSRQIDPRDEKVTIQCWWDCHHEGKGDYEQWLTGSAGPEVWRNLNIDKLIKPNKVVLKIGVGLGYCTRELARRKCVVHALDISPVALRRVEPFTAKTWLPSSLPDIPENLFDLAISHLVTQHMADKDLVEQISGVLKSLKPSGIFAMQFAFAYNRSQNDLTSPSAELIKTGGVGRSLGGMARLVDQAGGLIVWASRFSMFPDQGAGWYAIHIVRPDHPLPNLVRQERLTILSRVEAARARWINRLAAILNIHEPHNQEHPAKPETE